MNGRGSFSKVRGQSDVVARLSEALAAGRVPHAYVFAGPEGVGKKTTARCWAQIVLCANAPGPMEACGRCGSCQKVEKNVHPDLLWVDFSFQAALLKESVDKQKTLKIDTVRQMEHALRLRPMEGSSKVAVIAPAESLGEEASHALLKILEEPPEGTHMVLVTTEAGALLPTLRSRCQRVRFRPLALEVLTGLLAEAHGQRTTEELDRAAKGADGSFTRAESLLEAEVGLDFDWAGCPLSELLAWAEGFQNPRLGRAAAERFVESLLGRFQGDLREGTRPAADVERVFNALARLRQNANVGLTLQHTLLHLRRRARAEAA